MERLFDKPTRRTVLRQHLVSLGLLGLGVSSEVLAAKLQKPDVAYQDQPKDGKSCSSCRHYAAGQDGKGRCALVEGDVSAQGWCSAYTPR
jgi:hypothetical protein